MILALPSAAQLQSDPQGGDLTRGVPSPDGRTVEGGIAFINPGTPVVKDSEVNSQPVPRLPDGHVDLTGPWVGGGTVADIVATDRSRIVHIHVSDAKPQPPEEVRDNQRHMPGEGVIDLVGFFQALKKIGYQDAVSPEPLGRVPESMTPEDGARLGLDTTLAVMKRAGVA